MNDALVSIITPTYNRYDLLLQTIQSIADQTFKNVELIIIDDGSTDERYKQLSSYIETHFPQLYYKIIRNEINSKEIYGFGCAGANRNIGIKNSTGDYIAFCDDDDIWMPFKLTLQLEFMKKHDMKICCTEGYYVETPLTDLELQTYDFSKHPMHHGQKFSQYFIEAYQITSIPMIFNHKFIQQQNFLSNSSVIMTRELVHRVGDIDSLPNGQEDYGYWKRCLQFVDCLYIHIPTIAYRAYNIKY